MNTVSKALLRKRLLARRDAIPGAARDIFSRIIIERLIQTTDWPAIRCVHCYIPMAERHEVDTWRLVRYLWETWPDIETAVPGPLRPAGPISYLISHQTKWRKETVVPYPAKPERAACASFDLIIVPCLGFDSERYRLGYGAGYYDRFLSSQSKSITVGVAFHAGFVADGLPLERHDIALDRIITERMVL